VLSVKRVDRAIIDPIDRVARARFIFGPNAGLTVLLRYVDDDAKQITYDAKIVVGPDVAFHQPIFVAIDADPNAPPTRGGTTPASRLRSPGPSRTSAMRWPVASTATTPPCTAGRCRLRLG
jgi:hypothetical protein